MTTRPQTVRSKHQRVRKGSLVTGVAAATWLTCGVVLVAFTHSWWAWLFVAVGVLVGAAFLVLMPRLREAKERLEQMERLRVAQETAARAQLAARMRAFSQPEIRARFASR